MSGGKVALDTSVAIAVMNNFGDVATWLSAFTEVYLPTPVLGELLCGALNSSRVETNLQRVHHLASRCLILPVDARTAEVYAQLRLELKRIGKPIPENDLWIAAVCVEHGIPLATDDSHFSHLASLQLLPR